MRNVQESIVIDYRNGLNIGDRVKHPACRSRGKVMSFNAIGDKAEVRWGAAIGVYFTTQLVKVPR